MFQSPSNYHSDPGAQEISPKALEHLTATRPWLYVIAIFLFLGALMMIGMSLFVMLAGLVGSVSESAPSGAGVMVLGIGFLYVGMGVGMYLVPGVLISRYAGSISEAARLRSMPALEDALARQRTFWRYAGGVVAVMFAVVVGIFGLSLALGMMGGLLGGLMR